jgi:transcriptional repressor NrdR
MEILSRNIGEKILEKLWNIDLVAYIRFASVYRKFDDISHIYESIEKTEKRMYEKTKK